VNTEKAKILTDRVLQNPENDLADTLRAFRESSDSVWHIDRHVLDVDEASVASSEERISACIAGFGLLRKWHEDVSAEGPPDLIVSKPYLIIDDEWLEGEPHASSLHVYICLSKGEEGLAVEHEADHVKGMVLPSLVAEMLDEGEAFYRIRGAFEDEPGAWLIRVGTSAIS
jgi:hypothetical protein